VPNANDDRDDESHVFSRLGAFPKEPRRVPKERAMSDVSISAVESKIQRLETRVASIEQDRKRQLDERIERDRRRADLWLHLWLFASVMFFAVVMTVVVTLAVTGQD
jgi:hypothetical protein